jgi:HEPN domain-containing protein
MPHDPARVAEARSWLRRAWSDLAAASILLEAAEPRPDAALFHCQQAVEKAWKAFLFWHDTPFRKTHDLRELGELCANLDPALGSLADAAAELTPLAWLYRYPGEPAEPTTEEGDEALNLAREVYEAVLSRLPPEVRPKP